MTTNSPLGDGKDAATVPIEQRVATDRRKARKRHLLIYRRQLRFWLLMTALAAASYPFHHLSLSFDPLLRVALGSIPPLLFAVAWLYHRTMYKNKQDHEWVNALHKAQALLNPQDTADGYTQVFGVYTEAKRRSSQLITCASFLLVYAVTGAIAYAEPALNGLSMDSATVYSILSWLELGASVAVAFVLLDYAFKLGSSCLPGDVIVRHTLALALRVTSSVNDAKEAKRQIEEDTQNFMKKSPWWFYPGSS